MYVRVVPVDEPDRGYAYRAFEEDEVVGRVEVWDEARVVSLARAARRVERAREGARQPALTARGEVGVVRVNHVRADALEDGVEVGRARVRREYQMLHAASHRQIRARHVLVDVGENLLPLFGVFAEELILRCYLVRPPESKVALRALHLPFFDEPVECARELKQVRAAAPVVVRRRLLLLQVRGQNYLLRVGLCASYDGLDEARAAGRGAELGRDLRLDDDAPALRGLARGEEVLRVVGREYAAQRVALARRDREGERLTPARDGRGVDALPSYLVGHVVRAAVLGGLVCDDADRAALLDGVDDRALRRPARENYLALHVEVL